MRRTRLTRTLGLLALGGPASAAALAAQQPPLIAVTGDFMPYAGVKHAESGAPVGNLDVLVNMPSVELNLPVRLGSASALVVSARYGVLTFNYQDGEAPLAAPDNLSEVALGVTGIFGLGETWRAVASVRPSIASDWEDVDGSHVRWQGALVLRRSPRPGNAIGAGAAYRNDFGTGKLLPVLQLEHRVGGLQLQIDAPRRIEVTGRVSGATRLGVTAQVEGNRYRIGRVPDDLAYEVRYSAITAGPVVAFTANANLTLRLSGGVVTARRFEVVDVDRNVTGDLDLSSGGFFRVRLEYRPTLHQAATDRPQP